MTVVPSTLTALHAQQRGADLRAHRVERTARRTRSTYRARTRPAL